MDVWIFFLEDMRNGLETKMGRFTDFCLDILAHTANSIFFYLGPRVSKTDVKKTTKNRHSLKKSMRAPGPLQNKAMAGKSSVTFCGSEKFLENRIKNTDTKWNRADN